MSGALAPSATRSSSELPRRIAVTAGAAAVVLGARYVRLPFVDEVAFGENPPDLLGTGIGILSPTGLGLMPFLAGYLLVELFHFFAPWAPVEILVPPERAVEAAAICERIERR
jgi:hypothetical protein